MFSNMILSNAANTAQISSAILDIIFSFFPFVVFALFGLFLLPSLVALAKRNNRTKVILFNIFLGWTIVMWIICLVWAFKKEEKPIESKMNVLPKGTSPADELIKYKGLLDSGAISQDEFEQVKNQLFENM